MSLKTCMSSYAGHELKRVGALWRKTHSHTHRRWGWPVTVNPLHLSCRNVFNESDNWPKKYDRTQRKQLEAYWRDKIKHHKFDLSGDQTKEKYYVLSMFPYPSGRLHMGHTRVYTISDVMARYHRLMGKQVLHPMGWDAFGLPAENAAIDGGEVPQEWTRGNIAKMKKQLDELCCSFDWDVEFATCDPVYYRWTQYLFLKMFERGLVYQRDALVNWDPIDKTVLADEQIDEEGCSWRSGAKAEKKFLRQWYIKTTAYSKSLLEGLKEVDAEMWGDVIPMQENWIGECNGCSLEFSVYRDNGEVLVDPLILFTQTPEAVYGASHILVSKEHILNDRQFYHSNSSEQDDDIRLTLKVLNPFTQQKLPVYVGTAKDFGEYQNSYLAIPSLSIQDQKFAEDNKLGFTEVVHASEKGEDTIINSGLLSGLDRKTAFGKAVALARDFKCGGHITSERLRDWLISRQRYWGTPIPIIHCEKYGAVPVPYDELPVLLPEVSEFTGRGASPLTGVEDWLRVKCPKCDCDGYGRRETDTMDTFVDSSWYYLRYLDSQNKMEPFSKEKAERYMPVDLYIGGKEHAIMHLYYTRFFHHFLFEEGMVPTREPFINLLTQGMVMGKSYCLKDSGRYIPATDVDFTGSEPVQKETGAALVVKQEKMSKSKYNGVDPQHVLDEYGADATRLAILSNVAPKSDRLWSEDILVGVMRFQGRLWTLVFDLMEARKDNSATHKGKVEEEESICDIRNYFLKEVSYHMERSFLLSVAISRLQGFANKLNKLSSSRDVLICSCQFERALADLIIMLAPFAPMFASELWTGLQNLPFKLTVDEYDWPKGLLEQSFPELDAHYRPALKIKEDGRDSPFEVQLPMPVSELDTMTKEYALNLVMEDERCGKRLSELDVENVRLIIVPHLRAELHIITRKKLKSKMKNKKK